MEHFQPPVQWVPDIKWPEHEADHSPPFIDKIKNMELYLHSPRLHVAG
jgi:hypothetical protein